MPLGFAILLAASPVILLAVWLVWWNWGRPHLYRRWVRSLPEFTGERPAVRR